MQIELYSTGGKSGGTFETSGKTLGDILPTIQAHNIRTEGMRIVVGETETELLGPDSLLPAHDFTLFFYQIENKGGAAVAKPKRSDIYDAINAAVNSGKASKEDFSVGGKNFTMVGSDLLLEKLQSLGISIGGSIPATSAPAKIVKPEVIKKEKAYKAEVAEVKRDNAPVVLNTTAKEVMSQCILSLGTVSIPSQHQSDFDIAYNKLINIRDNWETKPKVDMSAKYNKIKSQLKRR